LKRNTVPLERVHIWLFKEDVEWVRETFDRGRGGMGFSDAIRMMVNRFHRQASAKAAKAASAQSEV